MTNRYPFVAPLLSLAIAAPITAQAPQPVAPNWSGWAQCQITIQAPGYSHRETHLWTITGAGTTNANMEIYPTSWTVTGNGSLQRVNGPTTVSAQWAVNGGLQNVTIGTTLHLDRITVQRWTNHGPARSGLTGTEISTTNGVARPRAVILDVQQWAFPGIETGTTSTRATGSNTLPFDGLRGPMNPPSGATGTATCSWDFARGSSTAAPPPATTPPPASGGNVSGGIPSGGASSSGTASPTTPGASAAGGVASGGSPGGTTASGSAGGAIGGGSADLSSGVNLRAVPPYVAPANGMVGYDIAVWNRGPSTANGAMLKVSASAGPSNWSNFVCYTSQGPAPVPCPSGIAAGTIQSGLPIPSLPPNTGFKVWFDAAVPGTVGSNLSVTATITPPAGVTDATPGNNSSTLTFPIVAPASSGSAGGSAAGGGGADISVAINPVGYPLPASWPANAQVQYGLLVSNLGPGPADGATVTVPAGSGLTKTAVACGSGGGAQFTNPTVAQIESGFVIPTLPAGGRMQCVVTASVTAAAGSSVTMTINAPAPAGVVDPNSGNNTATNTMPIVSSSSSGGSPGSGGGAGSGGANAGGGTGSSGVNFRAFTTSSAFVVPAGVTTIGIELWGAGGGGAAGANGGIGAFSGPVGGAGGGGGGSGAYVRTTLSVTPGSNYNVVIGAGGNAGGGKGGDSEFRQGSTLLASAAGGSGGAGPAGGAGGVSTPGASVIARNGLNGSSAGVLPPQTGNCSGGPPCQVSQGGAPGGAGGGPISGSVPPVGTTGGAGGSGGGVNRVFFTNSQSQGSAGMGGTGTPGAPGYVLITW